MMDKIVELWPETTHWIDNKRTPWILAGFTIQASKIPVNWRLSAPFHTGICESSHYADNKAIGRKGSLLSSVLK